MKVELTEDGCILISPSSDVEKQSLISFADVEKDTPAVGFCSGTAGKWAVLSVVHGQKEKVALAMWLFSDLSAKIAGQMNRRHDSFQN